MLYKKKLLYTASEKSDSEAMDIAEKATGDEHSAASAGTSSTTVRSPFSQHIT